MGFGGRLRRARASAFHGFVNVHKPPGVTSHHCVAVMRKIFNTREVGHAGTLDPMATGVMVMAIGRATKFLQYLTSGKEYRGVIRFGLTTSTDDITGDVLTERQASWLTRETVTSHLSRFVGVIDQTPPRISALKVDGKRSYELARANEDFEVKSRRVEIEQIDLLNFSTGDFPEATIHVRCGAGTYIRSIARECGEVLEIPPHHADETCLLRNASGALCVGGTLASLHRTRSGAFSINHSHDFDRVRELHESGQTPLSPIEDGLRHLPFIQLPDFRVDHWRKGGAVTFNPLDVVMSNKETPVETGTTLRIYASSSPTEFLGVSHVEKTGPNGDCILRKRTFINEQ